MPHQTPTAGVKSLTPGVPRYAGFALFDLSSSLATPALMGDINDEAIRIANARCARAPE